jgi:hypothetical protein
MNEWLRPRKRESAGLETDGGHLPARLFHRGNRRERSAGYADIKKD